MTIAIDFDGTIVEHKYPKIGSEIPEKDKNNHFSRKLKVDMFIDDRNLGGLPDWGTIYQMIANHETWETLNYRHLSLKEHKAPKKKHWWSF